MNSIEVNFLPLHALCVCVCADKPVSQHDVQDAVHGHVVDVVEARKCDSVDGVQTAFARQHELLRKQSHVERVQRVSRRWI